MRGKEEIKKTIEEGKAVLGIEFGSTRIKAVLIDEDKKNSERIVKNSVKIV